MAYSATQDLLLGNIPLPAGDKAQRAVDRAADEIDSMLGAKYKVPIVPTGSNQRAVRTLLLTINNWLASGRLIMELTASSQAVEQHAYAQRLINEAQATLIKILTGAINLDGCTVVTGESVAESGPMIYNVDAESNVEAFNDRVTDPLSAYIGCPPQTYWGRVPYWYGG